MGDWMPVRASTTACDSRNVALTLPCATCAPNAPVEVVDDEVRCLSCHTVRTFVRTPLLLVTGAPGTGKSTIAPLLSRQFPGTAVLDTDLFGPWSNPDWEAWANSWLLVVHALAQSGLRSVLIGYGLSRSKVATLAAKDLLGHVRAINLHLDPDVLRARLHERGTYDAALIDRKVAAAAELHDEADKNVAVTNLPALEVAQRVAEWLARELGAPSSARHRADAE